MGLGWARPLHPPHCSLGETERDLWHRAREPSTVTIVDEPTVIQMELYRSSVRTGGETEGRGAVLAGRWAEGRGEQGAVDGSAGGDRQGGHMKDARYCTASISNGHRYANWTAH